LCKKTEYPVVMRLNAVQDIAILRWRLEPLLRRETALLAECRREGARKRKLDGIAPSGAADRNLRQF
jgi:hypothetical protein